MKPNPYDSPVEYIIEAEQLAELRAINTKLFGDGSHLTPDMRRDLANRMNVLLGQIEKNKAIPF